MTPTVRAPLVPALLAGAVLATGLGALAAARHAKPLHARGWAADGTLFVDGGAHTGVPLLDDAARTRVEARLSWAMSWPWGGPDIGGMALRVDAAGEGGADADLLLASTGTSTIGRYLLALHTRPDAGPMTTLLPMTSPTGPLLLRLDRDPASPDDRPSYDLSWSRARGPWQRAGRLAIEEWGPDRRLRFRPVERPPAGLAVPGWVRALRAPAYRTARAVVPRAGRARIANPTYATMAA